VSLTSKRPKFMVLISDLPICSPCPGCACRLGSKVSSRWQHLRRQLLGKEAQHGRSESARGGGAVRALRALRRLHAAGPGVPCTAQRQAE